MSEADVTLQMVLLNAILPIAVLWLVLRYGFGVTLQGLRMKFEALGVHFVMGMIHSRLCSQEKETLFKSLTDLKTKLKGNDLNILEIGVGDGQNFAHYPDGSSVKALDPNPNHEYFMNKNLHRFKDHILFTGFIKAFGENMSEIADGTYDAVVCTFTMCTVENPEAVINEVHRVLKNNGVFLFLEHVAGKPTSVTRLIQDWMQVVWPYLAGGCCLNRETWTFLDKSKFKEVKYQHFSAHTRVMFWFKPFLYGTATK